MQTDVLDMKILDNISGNFLNQRVIFNVLLRSPCTPSTLGLSFRPSLDSKFCMDKRKLFRIAGVILGDRVEI